MDLVLTILIVIAVQLVLFLYLRGKIQESLNATSLLRQVQEEIDAMVKELNISAERNIGLLESRISDLTGLLQQADQKMLLLAREVERRDKTAQVYTQLKKAVPEPEVPPQPELALVDPPAVAPPVETKPLSLKDRVLALRQRGLSSREIASQTGATEGEVELIFSLHPGYE